MYKALAGIKPDPEVPGFKNSLIEPHFVDGLGQFECEFDTPYGKILSSWRKTGNNIFFDLTIPPNATSTLKINVKPGQVIFQNKQKLQLKNNQFLNINLISGKYSFEIK